MWPNRIGNSAEVSDSKTSLELLASVASERRKFLQKKESHSPHLRSIDGPVPFRDQFRSAGDAARGGTNGPASPSACGPLVQGGGYTHRQREAVEEAQEARAERTYGDVRIAHLDVAMRRPAISGWRGLLAAVGEALTMPNAVLRLR